ncbi:hypothetical protein ACIBJF_20470 [Streptomyces sp. NPDC050743]|uniref:hypothetical protein n=1 Tax=Streptomyces sp. NPDC050743 TaxID=3365634 RepID=UPI0037971F8A
MPDRRLLVKLWLAAMSVFLLPTVLLCTGDVTHDALSWSTAYEVVMDLVFYAVLAVLFAVYAYGALHRRARGTDIPVTAETLAATQEHTFPADRATRLRVGLPMCERAWDVLSGEEIHFRWRPFRGRRSVSGTVTFDSASGEARLRIGADENLTTGLGLRRASAFVALCQIVRLEAPIDRQAVCGSGSVVWVTWGRWR